MKLFGDVAANIGSRGGRESDRRRETKPLAKLSQPCVIRAKVVSPFADAMSFVDRQQCDFGPPQGLDKTRVTEPLRRDINQIELARRHFLEAFALFGKRQHAVDEGRRYTACLKTIDLVLHQRDQR